MSTHDPDHGGSDVALQEGDLPARFDNPGLPEHAHRLTDTDPKAARRAERQVAFLFVLSMIGTLVVLVGYFSVKFHDNLGFTEYLNRLELSNKVLGIGLAVALLGIGVGAVHWAKTLMPDEERIDYRHLQRGTDEERAEAVEKLATGAEESGFARRPLIRNTLIGAMALFPLPGLVFFRDTGPLPGDDLSTTFWKAGDRLMLDPEGGPIKASDMVLGAVAHVMPEGIEESEHPLNEKAKAAVLLIRLEEDKLAAESLPGAYGGIVAYSKICTHMGCPVALYEQQTHHLLCPCHQSTFDLTQNCKVIFGPAKRPLPQLAITVDDEGYLVAKEPFHEAVGPSFWERG
ncbi:Rieske (2Fe-2S) protein [Kineosporia sp. J2-2]|uniref:Cytochrome bc1 complex Rieske iron-sulfur subunit n=1 Tax=Kineosporia corallincola TaxID=2835133 RepID=A0ABS5TIU7_9ACTN|nr:Rieske 2Fe-2S domain-containing protein [Kineosporia corallincola]MBT0771018.1 Rieske (2Fe-2S) protein [Kineosporia corallincola]